MKKSALLLIVPLLASCEVKKTLPHGEILEYGIVKPNEKANLIDGAGTGGKLLTHDTLLEFTEWTERIPAVQGIHFTFISKISGFPDGPVRLLWTVKHPEISMPDGSVTTGYSYEKTFESINGIILNQSGYQLTEPFEVVTGDWEFSYSHDGRVLVSQRFVTYSP